MRQTPFQQLREEFIDFYKFGASRSLRTDQEIWHDVEKLLHRTGLNKGEILAVCNEFIEQGRFAREQYQSKEEEEQQTEEPKKEDEENQ